MECLAGWQPARPLPGRPKPYYPQLPHFLPVYLLRQRHLCLAQRPLTGPTVTTLINDIASHATRYVDSLDQSQRTKSTYAFNDPELTRWHWTTPGNFPRNGLPLREMETSQRDAAMALLQTSLSAYGLQKSLDIISLQNDLGNDPELYYVTVFGTPGVEPWGWRWEGHHLSRRFNVINGKLSVTPFFLGAWPTVNNAGLKAMEREEWAARELVTSLDDNQRASCHFSTGHAWTSRYTK